MSEGRRHYDEDAGIPSWLKWIFVAINRVGFPIVAFACMYYMMTVSLKNITVALEKQSLDLETLIVTINSNHNESKEWRNQLLSDIRDVRSKLR